jgi:hypothetical protein
VNNVDIRPFIHAMVDTEWFYIGNTGIHSITAAKDGTIQGKWNITWTQAHPSGANYIPELALPENVGFCYCRDKTSTSMTVFTTDDQTAVKLQQKIHNINI